MQQMLTEHNLGRYTEIPKEVLMQITFDQTITGSSAVRVKKLHYCEDTIRESGTERPACREIIEKTKALNDKIALAEKMSGRTREDKINKRVAYDTIRAMQQKLEELRRSCCAGCVCNVKENSERVNLTRYGSSWESLSHVLVYLALTMLVYSNASKNKTEDDIKENAVVTPIHISRIQELTGLSDSSVRNAMTYWHDKGYIRRYYGMAESGVYYIRFAFDIDQLKYKEAKEAGSGYVTIPNKLLLAALKLKKITHLRMFLAVILNVDHFLYKNTKANRHDLVSGRDLTLDTPFIKYIQRPSNSSLYSIRDAFVKELNTLLPENCSISFEGGQLHWPLAIATPQHFETENYGLKTEALSRNRTETSYNIIETAKQYLFGDRIQHGTFYRNDSLSRQLLDEDYDPRTADMNIPNVGQAITNIENHLGTDHLYSALVDTFASHKHQLERFERECTDKDKTAALVDKLSAAIMAVARNSRFEILRSRVILS